MIQLKLQDGLTQIPKCVLWPQNRLEYQAGVGGLPEQEVTEPHFPRSSYQDVRMRRVIGVEALIKQRLRDITMVSGEKTEDKHILLSHNNFLPLSYPCSVKHHSIH